METKQFKPANVVRVSSEFEKLQVKAQLALEGFGYVCIGMLIYFWIKGV
jgi:uncharacterized protein YjeT (DUF2065 family)